MRHEFIHKLFLMRNVDAAERNALIESYVDRCIEWAADLRRAERMLEPTLRAECGKRLVPIAVSAAPVPAGGMRGELGAQHQGRNPLGQGQAQAPGRRSPERPFQRIAAVPARRVGRA
jgi:hypothetical protein